MPIPTATFATQEESQLALDELKAATWRIINGNDHMTQCSFSRQLARIVSEHRQWPQGTSLALLLVFPAEVGFTLLAERGGRPAIRGT